MMERDARTGRVSATRRPGRRSGAVAVLLVALATTATACSSTGTSSGSGPAQAGGGTLTVGLPFQPQSLNPGANGNGGQNIVQWLAYEPLIRVESDGTYSPGLATSWEYVGAGNTRFDMKIRTDAVFADGTPVTADAVADTITYYLKNPAALSHYLTGIKGATASGDTVSIALDTPNPLLPLVFSQVTNWGDIISPAGLAAPEKLTQEMFGAGAYTMESAVTGDTYTFAKNPKYWNPEDQNYDKVVVKVIPDANAAQQALNSDQIDVYLGGAGAQAEQARSNGLQAVAGQPNVNALFLLDRAGVSEPALRDVRVRQALNYAVDRASIATALGGGFEPISQVSAEGYDGYDPALDEAYPYDPAKAKQLLAEAGYPNGFTLKTLDVALQSLDTMTQAVQQQLAAVGVKVEIKSDGVDLNKFISDMASKQYGAAAFGLSGPMFASALQNFAAPTSPLNPFKSSDPKVDAAFKALALAKPDEQVAAAQALNRAVVEQAWFLPVASADNYMFAREEVKQLGELNGFGGVDVLKWSS